MHVTDTNSKATEGMISHYTSIASLEAILSTRKLRFTRLDQFDDVKEAQTIAGIDFGGQYFASSWVIDEEEDIAQWQAYGDSYRGVRISLPTDPFEWEFLDGIHSPPGTTASWEFKEVRAPFRWEEMCGNGYVLIPPGIDGRPFLQPVTYVDDVQAVYERHVRTDVDTLIVDGHITDLAHYKWRKWEHQKEHRFVLKTASAPAIEPSDAERYGPALMKLMKTPEWPYQGALATHVHLRLSSTAIDRLVVTAGPLVTEEGKERIGRILKQHAPLARMISSELEGSIRSRCLTT